MLECVGATTLVAKGKVRKEWGSISLGVLAVCLVVFFGSKNVFVIFLLASKMNSMHMCTLEIVYTDGGWILITSFTKPHPNLLHVANWMTLDNGALWAKKLLVNFTSMKIPPRKDEGKIISTCRWKLLPLLTPSCEGNIKINWKADQIGPPWHLAIGVLPSYVSW